MMNSTPSGRVVFTQKQVMAQSLLINNFVAGNTWYVDLVKSIAYYPRALSTKQEAVLDKLIAKVTNTPPPAAVVPQALTVTGHDSLFTLFKNARQHLKRAHIYIPLDLSKPIDKHAEQLKIALPANGLSPLWLSVKRRGMNYWVGSLDDRGVLHFAPKRLRAAGISDTLIQTTLDVLCQDPVGNTSKWGKLLSRCCFCNLPLSTKESLFAGYGDVCAKHYHLPWGKHFGVLTPQQAML